MRTVFMMITLAVTDVLGGRQARTPAGEIISVRRDSLCPRPFRAGYVTTSKAAAEYEFADMMTPPACAQAAQRAGAAGWGMTIDALNDVTTTGSCFYYLCGFDPDDPTHMSDDDYYYQGLTYAVCELTSDDVTMPPSQASARHNTNPQAGQLSFGARDALCSDPDGWQFGWVPLADEQWYYVGGDSNQMTPEACKLAVEAMPRATGWSMIDRALRSSCPVSAGVCVYFVDPFNPDDAYEGNDAIYEDGEYYPFCDLQSVTPNPPPTAPPAWNQPPTAPPVSTPPPTPPPTSPPTYCPDGYKDFSVRFNWGLGLVKISESPQACADRCTQFSGSQFNGGCKGYMTGMYMGMLYCRSYGGQRRDQPCAPWAHPSSPGLFSGAVGSTDGRTGTLNVGGQCCTNMSSL